jgi:hypothetical protein
MKVDPDRLAELEEERRFLLRSLTDLEHEREAGDLDDHDYTELKDGYTARAAAVLREIDQGHATLSARPPRRWGRTLLIAAGVVVVAIAAGLAVARWSGQRLPSDSSSGDIAESVNTLLIEARGLQTTDPRGAIEKYDEVLKVQPDNAEALTYRGWMLVTVGSAAVERGVTGGDQLVARGEAGIDQAMAVAPDYADAACFKAITRFRFYGDAAGAKPAVDRCVAANPPQVVLGLVEGLQADINAALAGGGSSSGTTTATTAAAPTATTAAG